MGHQEDPKISKKSIYNHNPFENPPITSNLPPVRVLNRIMIYVDRLMKTLPHNQKPHDMHRQDARAKNHKSCIL